ncbi:YeeE/YedE family protein, partial [Chromobacterium piscinae]
DWTHFTPWSALAGGALIGLAAAWLIVLNGRIAGISGIVGNLLAPGADKGWRLAFVAGLVLSPWLYRVFAAPPDI